MNLTKFIRESNAIEGIHRDPHPSEEDALKKLLAVFCPRVDDIVQFVAVIQPDALLRSCHGLNVTVGHYRPPPGSPRTFETLSFILIDAFSRLDTPYEIHQRYEALHPFTDGNGRSGRALWLWQMLHDMTDAGRESWNRGFLHEWYYQSLAHKETTP